MTCAYCMSRPSALTDSQGYPACSYCDALAATAEELVEFEESEYERMTVKLR